MDIKDKIKDLILEAIKINHPNFVSDGVMNIEHPKDLKFGDYAFTGLMKIYAKLRKQEKDLLGDKASYLGGHQLFSQELVTYLNSNKPHYITEVKVAGAGFINFYLSRQFFTNSVKEILKQKGDWGKNNSLKGKKIMVEFTDPNPFKEFHIGHLMPNVIGESISRVIESNGAEVKKVNYQGDIGMHVACAVWGIKNKKGIVESDIKTEVQYLGECYADGAKALKESEESKKEIQEINKKLYEKNDEELNKLYEWGRKVSLDYFEIMYERLGSIFDFYFFESEVGEFGKQIVLKFLKEGIFEESDGAIVFHGEKYTKSLHTRVFINSQGLPTYEAKELGLAKLKYEKYPYDTSIIITGNEINEYFKVLLTAMQEVFPELAKKTVHISHGMLRLPTGKMSSRTGNVITAESLIDQVREKVFEKIKDREFTDKEKEKIAETVSIGAIKYSILHQATSGDIIFDFDKSLSFEGDSGPYLQYTAVRANSIIKKAEPLGICAGFKDVPTETTLLEHLLYQFPEIVSHSYETLEPHHIATYLTELSSAFNTFYGSTQIVNKTDPYAPYRIALVEAFYQTMKDGLYLLGIETPDKM